MDTGLHYVLLGLAGLIALSVVVISAAATERDRVDHGPAKIVLAGLAQGLLVTASAMFYVVAFTCINFLDTSCTPTPTTAENLLAHTTPLLIPIWGAILLRFTHVSWPLAIGISLGLCLPTVLAPVVLVIVLFMWPVGLFLYVFFLAGLWIAVPLAIFLAHRSSTRAQAAEIAPRT